MERIINQRRAYLLALLAVLFWSTMSSAFKITLRYIAFDQLLLFASFFGVISLAIINRTRKERAKFLQLTKKEILSSALMGLLNPFLYYLILFKAYELLEAQIAGTLNYAWPVVLVLLSIPFLKQKISRASLLAILISFFGLVIISTRGDLLIFTFANPLGVSLAIGSAFIWALYWILNFKDQREDTAKILLNLSFGFLYILIYTLIKYRKIEIPGWEALLGSVYIGLFEMSITFVIWLSALKFSSDTAKVSNLIYLSPFLALFIIRITVGEAILPSTVIGLFIIISGIILQQSISRLKRKFKKFSGKA
ncbi:MAG TPA: DMT family transporter [Bacteroidales bacterium]